MASSALEHLAQDVSIANPREYVRAAALSVYLQLRFGTLNLDEADVASQLLPIVSDPHVVLSFLSGYGIGLALCARYREAEEAATELLTTADRHRFSFAIPYGLCTYAMALSGRRDWTGSEAAARDALRQASERRDTHAILLSSSILLRVYAQQARYREALAITPVSRGAVQASIAELNCSRALVLACAGRDDDARQLVRSSPETRAVEPVVLSRAVEAVIACRSGSPDAVESVREFEQVAFEIGAIDLLVVSYRACPELLTVLLHVSRDGRVEDLLRQVGDVDLARAAGHPIPDDEDRVSLLSPREREVYDLLRTGLTNPQIAKLLYIEPSTVKVHTQHIYDKLGVRSRTALAIQAALERSDQATSATSSADSAERT